MCLNVWNKEKDIETIDNYVTTNEILCTIFQKVQNVCPRGRKCFFMGKGAIFQVINAYKGRGLLFDPSVRTYPEWNRN